jgi:hypothetical protein
MERIDSLEILRATKLSPLQATAYIDSLKVVGLTLGGPNNYMRIKKRKRALYVTF